MTQSPIGNIFIRRMTRDDPGFYECMGPLFGSRQIAKEVGIPMFDDADKKWFLALDDELLGCASVRGSLISDCYVFDRFRGRGVFTKILATLLDRTTGSMTANCTKLSRGVFFVYGFRPVSFTKNFTRMRLDRA